ncbi:hypothetical protein HZB90_04760, partial [archaeon]|nr:hypothetical protein [archaeon]
RVSRAGKITDIEQFFTKIDVNLKRSYGLATDIVNSEIAFHFLESHTLNLIAMYSKPVGANRLPPTAYFSFDRGEYLIWTTSETRDRLESYVLPPGINMLQIVGTSNYRRHALFDADTMKYDRVGTGLVDKSLVMLNSSNSYPQLETRMIYLDWWPIYLNINDAEVLKPTEIAPVFGVILSELIGMKRYMFLYDISFPVLVTITDPYAFAGKGLKFVIAMEANMRDNTILNTSFFRLPSLPSPSYFCDINQRNSGLMGIEVNEMYTGDPVPDARVDFIAGEELCFIGNTKLDERNRSVLSANFPIGMGEIRVIKDDYVMVRKPFNAFMDQGGNYTFSMMPFLTINATVAPVPLSYQQGRYILPGGVPTASLSPKETAIMTFKRMDDDEFGEYDAFLTQNATSGMSELMIVPGTYEVAGYIMLHDNIRIPKEQKTIDIPFSDDKTITMNESVFDSWTTGGVVFNNVTGYLTITRDDLLNSDYVRFKMLRFPLPITHSNEISPGPDLSQAGQYEDYTNIYKHELQPDWVR